MAPLNHVDDAVHVWARGASFPRCEVTDTLACRSTLQLVCIHESICMTPPDPKPSGHMKDNGGN